MLPDLTWYSSLNLLPLAALRQWQDSTGQQTAPYSLNNQDFDKEPRTTKISAEFSYQYKADHTDLIVTRLG